jgi:hypothetical protein
MALCVRATAIQCSPRDSSHRRAAAAPPDSAVSSSSGQRSAGCRPSDRRAGRGHSGRLATTPTAVSRPAIWRTVAGLVGVEVAEAFIATHPELRHVRTRVRSPGQNGSRERGFGTLKYERLFLEEIDDVLDLTVHAERYRVDYNTVRPHEALSWNRPHDVHIGLADPRVPNFPKPEILPTA